MLTNQIFANFDPNCEVVCPNTTPNHTSFEFQRMNSKVTLHYPNANIDPLSWSQEDVDRLEKLASEIDHGTQWIQSDKMFVLFANVDFDDIEGLTEAEDFRGFLQSQQVWNGHPLFSLLSQSPNVLSLADVQQLLQYDLKGANTTGQCVATVNYTPPGGKASDYVCLVVSVGDLSTEATFQVSFLFLKLAAHSPKYVCSYRAEYFQDQLKVLEKLWTLHPKYDLKSLIVRQAMEYQFPTLEPLVEITSDTVPPEEILVLLRDVPDGHTMVETFAEQYMIRNPMKRTYTGDPENDDGC